MSGSRIYPTDAYKIYNGQSLSINHSENYKLAYFEPENIKIIKDRGQARAIRKKTKFKNVVAGDVFYEKLCWSNFEMISPLGKSGPLDKSGLAIVRNGKIIWYLMPGIPEGISKRFVIIEKINKKSILQKLFNFNNNIIRHNDNRRF